MSYECPHCGQEMQHIDFQKFRVGIPTLRHLRQSAKVCFCSSCKKKLLLLRVMPDSGGPVQMYSPHIPMSRSKNQKSFYISLRRMHYESFLAVDYFAVFGEEGEELIPAREASIQDATMINKYGDPDLMSKFAEEYLKQFKVLMPSGRLPSNLVEMMPPLLLLVTAAELVLKSFLIRSDCEKYREHSLFNLYNCLNPEHKSDIEYRVATSPIVLQLTAMDINAPSVEGILQSYDKIYSESRGAYTESRYYAEPTEMFKKSDKLYGANLGKSGTPYPVFLPGIVQEFLKSYKYFAGAERLKRLGAEIDKNIRDTASHKHGDYGLIPSSLGLTVVIVSQAASKDTRHQDLPAFKNFKALYRPLFVLDWMHGGDTLLFYRAKAEDRRDGFQVIENLECQVISNHIVGMHSRDLYKLADILEATDSSSNPLET